MSRRHDLVILGSGTTAFAAALKGAQQGARVLMVEQGKLGGTCVNWGCVPSKTLIHLAELHFSAQRAAPFGVKLEAAFPDCSRVMAAKQQAVDTLRQQHYQAVLDDNPRIEVLRGHGHFISPRELQVGAEVVVSDRILIAAGGVPRVLHIPGLAEAGYLTSYSALHLPCFPESLLIIGGGVIALEMGQMFRRFGTKVTVLEHSRALLKEFDPRLTSLLQQLLQEEGMEFVFGVESQRVFSKGEETCLEALVDGQPRTFRADRLMLAVGTAPATEGIGLAAAGVQLDGRGFISTDEEMRTSQPGIWAAGDVTGPPLIAPAGIREGEVAVENMLDPGAHRRIQHRVTPMAVFIDPEIASVGDTAAQARAQGREVVESFVDLGQVAKSHIMGGRQGAVLLIAEKGTGRILGCQLLAPRAADVIHEAVLAVRCGLSVYDLAETVHVYPTISDGLRLAAQDNVRRQGSGE
ncbi:dihydrolipoyl dehydrogenase family protein [Trichloromonas sp.]|uniref:dihydrolipoyl dehydrogenase family protein n=1 Tax=Trichloromonas sp. TaxID=3069249 RepID=UPI003D816086